MRFVFCGSSNTIKALMNLSHQEIHGLPISCKPYHLLIVFFLILGIRLINAHL